MRARNARIDRARAAGMLERGRQRTGNAEAPRGRMSGCCSVCWRDEERRIQILELGGEALPAHLTTCYVNINMTVLLLPTNKLLYM